MSSTKPIRDMDIAELFEELESRAAELEDATRRESEASRNEIVARNAVNEVQKALDARLAECRKKAPRGTDWAAVRNTGTSI